MNARGRHPSAPSQTDAPDPGRNPFLRSLMQILWPAFLGAAITTGAVFSLVDPLTIDVVVESLDGSREAAYTIGFIGFWIVFMLACALSWVLASTEHRGARGADTDQRERRIDSASR